VHHIINYFSDPMWWDIGNYHSWIIAAFAYAIVVLIIARFCGMNGKRASEDPYTGVPFGCQEDSVGINPNAPPVIDPNSPMAYSQPGPTRTYKDIDMDDPEWAARLEDEL
jgi:hypothetical protein